MERSHVTHSNSEHWQVSQLTFRSFLTRTVAIVWMLLNTSYHPLTANVNAAEIGQGVRDDGIGATLCLTYEKADKTFSLRCNFNWTDHYREDDYIMLMQDEVFDGKDHKMSLHGLPNPWEGLFKINSTAGWDNAPVIKHARRNKFAWWVPRSRLPK